MCSIAIEGVSLPFSPFILGTAFYDPGQEAACHGLMDAYLSGGGTVIDTARSYGCSEEVVGSWRKTRKGARDRIVLITKCGHRPELRLPEKGYADSVRQELSTSLKTLGTGWIDLYLLHRDNQEMPVSTILEPLHAAVAEGKVRAIGASNWEYRRVIEANGYAEQKRLPGFAVVSNTLSLARPAAAFYTGLVHTDPWGERWHQETGVPLLPWSCTARGFFTGAYTPEMRRDTALADPPTPTFTSRMLKVSATDENFARLARARELGAYKGGYTAVEVALAWVRSRPFPIAPIMGPRTTEEIASCWRGATLSLTDEESRWLEQGEALPSPATSPRL